MHSEDKRTSGWIKQHHMETTRASRMRAKTAGEQMTGMAYGLKSLYMAAHNSTDAAVTR